MQKNAAVLTVVCLIMCLTFNYTFPLHRDTGSSNYPNQTRKQDIPAHHNSMADRSKKIASNVEHAFKSIKDSTQDLGKNIYEHINSAAKFAEKKLLSGDELRHYEELVIMKKYPYLDLRELELSYSPSNKRERQSIKVEGSNLGNDPSICEPLEDGPNVEITSRGLSGFAIPPQISKRIAVDISKSNDKSSLNVLKSLRNDVLKYIEKKDVIIGYK